MTLFDRDLPALDGGTLPASSLEGRAVNVASRCGLAPHGRMADGVPLDVLEIGLPVEVRFERVSDEILLPLWVPRAGGASHAASG